MIVPEGCRSAPRKGELNPHAYRAGLNDKKDEILLDVRTPDEYKEAHLPGAVNIDWNDEGFMDKVAKLDKNKPVFVYCRSGHRSGLAAQALKSAGFDEVFNLDGGIMAWQKAGLRVTTDVPGPLKGITMDEYHQLLKSDKLVLVDFYATWCTPCKRMSPFLEEIAAEKAGKLELHQLDADKNTLVASELRISSLPTLLLYKKGKLAWTQTGFIDKDELLKKISTFE